MSKAERRASASGGAWKGEAGGLLLAAQERGGPCLGGGVDALLDGGGEGQRGAAPLRFLGPDEVPAGHGGERRVGGEAHVLPRAVAAAAKTGITWLIRTLISGGPSKCPEPLWPLTMPGPSRLAVTPRPAHGGARRPGPPPRGWRAREPRSAPIPREAPVNSTVLPVMLQSAAAPWARMWVTALLSLTCMRPSLSVK